MRWFRFASIILILSGCLSVNMDYGHFVGTVKTEWIRDSGQDIKMKLLDDFSYVDPKGKIWTAKKGYETDGASIPKAFWSTIGGPFEGGYREAAVIHDWYCYEKSEPWKDVHRIFYYASRAAGVAEGKAKLMYTAVRIGGPKWGADTSNCYSCHAMPGYSKDRKGRMTNFPTVTDDDVQKLANWVQDRNPSLEEIDSFAEKNYPSSKFGH